MYCKPTTYIFLCFKFNKHTYSDVKIITEKKYVPNSKDSLPIMLISVQIRNFKHKKDLKPTQFYL